MNPPEPITRRTAGKLILGPVLVHSANFRASAESPAHPWKILLVAAHPDDEYYFAATVYRIAQELGGVVDHVVITNGEGGFRYSALAEKIYGLPLTEESTGRRYLPQIRRKETLAAGRILGVRHHYFLNEKDQRFTLEAGEALEGVWHCTSVKERLRKILDGGQYDFVFTLLPRASEHGHHQAATLLALEVVEEMEPSRRPVVLAAEPGRRHQVLLFRGLDRFPRTQPASGEPAFSFDRGQTFGPRESLHYGIVVQWVIAEHKSQGLFQNDAGKHEVEHFWRFAIGPEAAAERTARLSEQLRRPYPAELKKVAQQ